MTNRDPVSSSWKGRSHGVLLDYVITCVQLQYIGIKEKGDVPYEKRGRQEYAERVTNNFLSFFFLWKAMTDTKWVRINHRVCASEGAAKCLSNKPGMLELGPEKRCGAGSLRPNGDKAH